MHSTRFGILRGNLNIIEADFVWSAPAFSPPISKERIGYYYHYGRLQIVLVSQN